MIQVNQIPTSASLSNTFLIQYKDRALMVDPGGRFDRIQAYLDERGIKPDAILLTHGHVDHIGAVEEVRQVYGARVYAHEDERALLKTPELNLTAYFGRPFEIIADEYLTEGPMKDFPDVRVIHTPGHTAGGVCYFIGGVLFTGDSLFQGSIGRTDLPTADPRALVPSIRQKLLSYPDRTLCYPGHGPETTIGMERRTNPFLGGY